MGGVDEHGTAAKNIAGNRKIATSYPETKSLPLIVGGRIPRLLTLWLPIHPMHITKWYYVFKLYCSNLCPQIRNDLYKKVSYQAQCRLNSKSSLVYGFRDLATSRC